MNKDEIGPPARRPCPSCPYRRDVPSGVWAASEYEKLRGYDRPTGEQPRGLFQCHQKDNGAEQSRLCAGWVGCHGVEGSLAFRFAVVLGTISMRTYDAAADYVSPVPLFASGGEAADHGMAEVGNPGPEAQRLMRKIRRVRSDLVEG